MVLRPLNPKLVSARITILAVSISLLAVAALFNPLNSEALLYIVFFSVSIFLTDFIVIEFEREGSVSASVALIMTAVFLGPKIIPVTAVMLAIIIGTLAAAPLPNRNFLNLLVRSAKSIIAVALAASVVWILINLMGTTQQFWSKLIVAVLAASVFFITETALEALFFSLENGTSFRIVFISKIRLLAFIYLTFAVIALSMALMFKWMNLWSIFLFSLPLAVIGQSFKLYLYIRQTYASTIKALTATIEAQDSKKDGHAQRVTDYSIAIARELGFFGNDLERLSYAAMLHDIGKLGLDKNVSSEQNKIPIHAKVGSEIISHVDYLKDVSAVIKFHHYPFSNDKTDVPVESRIIHLADAFDHLVSSSGLTRKDALDKLTEDKGLVYDPKVLRALKAVINRQSIGFFTKHESRTPPTSGQATNHQHV